MTAPVFNTQSVFSQLTPTSSLVVPLPVSTLPGDVDVLLAMDTIDAPLQAPAGWTEFSWSPLPIPGASLKAPIYIFLTAGTTWTVPADWSSRNTIECIGAGAGGESVAPGAAGGGGGGGYSKVSNAALTPGALIAYLVGLGGAADSPGGHVWFDGTDIDNCRVGARGGSPGVDGGGGKGGLTFNATGTTKYAGGAGNDGAGYNGGGGGGAAGPDGQGANGGTGAFPPGDPGDGPLVGGGGGGANNGTEGASGDDGGAGGAPGGGAGGTDASGSDGTGDAWYDATHGIGGGGGGAGNTASMIGDWSGGTGGEYGGGGGGGAAGGSGAPGLIVITYYPSGPPLRTRGFWTQDNIGGGNITLQKDAADSWLGAIVSITDCFPISPVTSVAVSNASSPLASIAGINLATPDSLVLWAGGLSAGPNFIAPGGFAEISHDQLDNYWTLGTAWRTFASTGPTGAIDAPIIGAAPSAVGLIAIRGNGLHMEPFQLAAGFVGIAYTSGVPPVSGFLGVDPYSYQVVGGALPPGVTMTTGVVHGYPGNRAIFAGTPTLSGIYTFTVRVTDGTAATDDQDFTIVIEPSDSIVLAGHAATGAVGSLRGSSATAITGNAAAGAVGTLSPIVAPALVGHSASGGLGVMRPTQALTLAGNAATAALGELAPRVGIDVAGHAASSALGVLTPSRRIDLLGVAATGAVGRLWPPFTSDPNYIVRYVYRGNTARFNPWRGNDDEGIP